MKISVVIPAFNEELLLASCLESLGRQTRTADELIVVDNNSSDRTAAIASSFGAKVITEKKQGIWAASATGYDAAGGDLIVRCDADSVLPETWLAQIEAIMSNTAALAVTGPGRFYGAPTIVCSLANIFYMKAYFLGVGSALGSRPLFGSNFAIRRHAWDTAKNHIHRREDIHDDIDLSYHLPAGSIHYDHTLVAQISIRPLLNIRSVPSRYSKGFRSIFIHWPERAPWAKKATRNG